LYEYKNKNVKNVKMKYLGVRYDRVEIDEIINLYEEMIAS
jgi:hypothetical protein